jgi:para-nitrobenzyl esterase
MQSGAFSLTHSRAKSAAIAMAYRDQLGLKDGDHQTLRRLSVERLLDAESAVARRIRGTSPAAPWFDGALLPASHEAAYARPTRPIPLLAGSNRDEITLFKVLPVPRVLPTRRAELRRLLERDLPKDSVARVLRAYPDTGAGERRFASDLTFTMPALHTAERHAVRAPTWVYRFDYAHPVLGACHALELFFLWDFRGPIPALMRGGFLTGMRSGLSERMRAAWTTFVRTGSPGEDWPRFTPSRRATRIFALQDHTVDDPDRATREAWGGTDVKVGA